MDIAGYLEQVRAAYESGDATEHSYRPALQSLGPAPLASGFPKWESSSPSGRNGRVRINKEQYFNGVPEIAWGFHIGGYQPAQKWLKDLRGRSLSWDDIGHYQKIVTILSETDRVMREIELPLDT